MTDFLNCIFGQENKDKNVFTYYMSIIPEYRL
jgi:hypothetical protein